MILHQGDSADVLKTLPDNSVDALLTDPPAGIAFMGKEWDTDKGGRDAWIAWLSSIMRECLRVMKPGAHGLVWSLPRTSHWTGMALELAGFEVRDKISHLFGSGFPKSHNISKAIDKAAGAERKILGKTTLPDRANGKGKWNPTTKGSGFDNVAYWGQTDITAPATDAAKQWDGWGTALKPAVEEYWLIRKPLSEDTVAQNVLKWGCGGLNIDGGRIPSVRQAAVVSYPNFRGNKYNDATNRDATNRTDSVTIPENLGRFPANLVLSHSEYCTEKQCDLECAVKRLDAQAKADVSRFFYCAKVSTSERNAGCEAIKSDHPTMKPIRLMRYMARLITPPNGIILDPFMGSGSTGCAAVLEGFDFVGIEKEHEYLEIAKKRIEHWSKDASPRASA